MKKGERVELLDDCDYFPYTYVCAGERGSVAHVNEQTGEVDVLLDTPHPGLADNCIWLLPARAVGPRVKVVPNRYSVPTYLKVAAVLAFGVGVAAIVPEGARALRGPPAVFKSFTLTKDHIHAGEPLVMRNTSRRERACLWTWQNTWTDTDTGSVVARTVSPGASAAITPNYVTYDVALKTPIILPLGHYELTAVGRAQCNHGDVFTVQQPALKFTVEN